MAKDRSPNYPALSLGDALEAIRALYNKERRTAVAPDVAVKAWGYRSLSGLARVKLAALKKYGLLESEGQGVRVSDRALMLLQYASETREYREALQAAANAPEIFAELALTHADASDDALRAYLVTKKAFSEAGARALIQSFRDTMALVGRGAEVYDPGMNTGNPPNAVVNPPAGKPNTQYIRVFSWPLPGDVTAEIRLSGGPVTREHLDVLGEYLAIAKKAVPEASTN